MMVCMCVQPRDCHQVSAMHGQHSAPSPPMFARCAEWCWARELHVGDCAQTRVSRCSHREYCICVTTQQLAHHHTTPPPGTQQCTGPVHLLLHRQPVLRKESPTSSLPGVSLKMTVLLTCESLRRDQRRASMPLKTATASTPSVAVSTIGSIGLACSEWQHSQCG
jgi:hypothetical protein